ncbi:zinc-binding dehydrogenase [Streptomyces sp. QTS52]
MSGGCHVTAISTSTDKKDDAHRADTFLISDQVSQAGERFDFILDTVGADLPWDDYFATLRPRGELCVVGVPASSFTISRMSILPASKSLVSALVGPPAVTRQLMDFAARHHIQAKAEVFPRDQIDQAIDHVRTAGPATAPSSTFAKPAVQPPASICVREKVLGWVAVIGSRPWGFAGCGRFQTGAPERRSRPHPWTRTPPPALLRRHAHGEGPPGPARPVVSRPGYHRRGAGSREIWVWCRCRVLAGCPVPRAPGVRGGGRAG